MLKRSSIYRELSADRVPIVLDIIDVERKRIFSGFFGNGRPLLVEDVTERLEEIVSFMEQIEREILLLLSFFSPYFASNCSPRSKVIVED